jgi:methionine-S-sulfoxide reductase
LWIKLKLKLKLKIKMKNLKRMEKENEEKKSDRIEFFSSKILLGIIAFVVVFVFIFISQKDDKKIILENKNEGIIKREISLKDYNKAYFAGGCFWCIEAPFQETKGVIEAISGYIGGSSENANYKSVITGKTKHRESVEVIYDKNKISYEELLKIFFAQINPTDEGGQFADRGFQYTSGIYFQNEDEKKMGEKIISDLEKSKKFDKEITVNILPFKEFFRAEEYHQDFYKKSSEYYKRYKKGSGRTGFIEEN